MLIMCQVGIIYINRSYTTVIMATVAYNTGCLAAAAARRHCDSRTKPRRHQYVYAHCFSAQ